jgi:hypothetical protein
MGEVVEIKVDGIFRPEQPLGAGWNVVRYIPLGRGGGVHRSPAGKQVRGRFVPETFDTEAEAQARCDELNDA